MANKYHRLSLIVFRVSLFIDDCKSIIGHDISWWVIVPPECEDLVFVDGWVLIELHIKLQILLFWRDHRKQFITFKSSLISKMFSIEIDLKFGGKWEWTLVENNWANSHFNEIKQRSIFFSSVLCSITLVVNSQSNKSFKCFANSLSKKKVDY